MPPQRNGYSEALYAARDEVRDANETAATNRARSLGFAALGKAVFERWCAAGVKLRDAQIQAIAFSAADV